jgi:Tol biopolymer transport system component
VSRVSFLPTADTRGLALAAALVALLLVLAAIGIAGGSRVSPPPLGDAEPPAVAVVPSASALVPRVTPFPVLPGEPWIAYMANIGSGGTDRLHLVRPDGNDRHQLVTGLDGQQEHPDWSPDGSRIAFDHWTPDVAVPGRDLIDIWTAAADGSDARRVAACDLPCFQLSYPAWSPDGTQLAVVRYDEQVGADWGPSAIEVVDLATGARRVVHESADGSIAYYNPRWSPDGSQIVFGLETYTDATEATFVSAALAVVAADGSDVAPRIITPAEVDAWEPDWHPSGDRIAFRTHFDPGDSADRTQPSDLYTIRPDGTGLTPVTSFGLGNQRAIEPTWTPDGQRIVFTLVDGFGGGQIPAIALVNADGGNVSRLGFAAGTAGRLRPTP